MDTRAQKRAGHSPAPGCDETTRSALLRSEFGEDCFEADPGTFPGFFVFGAAGGIFAGFHEAVAGAVVGDGIKLFTRRFHELDGFWNRRKSDNSTSEHQ